MTRKGPIGRFILNCELIIAMYHAHRTKVGGNVSLHKGRLIATRSTFYSMSIQVVMLHLLVCIRKLMCKVSALMIAIGDCCRQEGSGYLSSSFRIEVPFSNKNDTVPPGTSLTVGSGVVLRREMLSTSTASSSDDIRLFCNVPAWPTSSPCEEGGRYSKPRRMSSCTRSLASGFRQLI
jgi:hypothetical protein